MSNKMKVYIEETYGPLGSGAEALIIRHKVLFIREIMAKMGLNFDDIKVIDCATLAPNRHVIRYYEPEERHIVAMEIDDDLIIIVEHFSHLADWIGEEEYFGLNWQDSYTPGF